MLEPRSDTGAPIRLGISSCLLGNQVRFDGDHKRNHFATEVLGRFVEWVPVCPEIEAGMETPRPPMRLVRDAKGVRLLEIKSGRNHTGMLKTYSARRVRSLEALDLSGYVLKKDSPSCGMTRVKVYSQRGMARREGTGLYASALMDAFPNLPIEEEGRLEDSKLRENFIERLFAYERLRALFRARWSAGQVVTFHARHKLQLSAHSRAAYGELGRLVAALRDTVRADFRRQYERSFMAALEPIATPGRNADVLRHAAGHLEKHLDAASRGELAELIRGYRAGGVPLIVPITLIRHHARHHAVDYLNGQVYLDPHPSERMLRNHV